MTVIASSSVEALRPETLGRYELLLELARGGMAVLYLARARGLGGFSRLFAIKRILPHLAADPMFVEMFLNEGRIAARLSHPNLCPVFELGHDRGELFLVMDYLDGVPWEALAAGAPRDARGLQLAAGVLGQACEGLHHAHTFCDVDGTPMPILHRDVSPQNVFVSADGVCRVLDFGVSKIATDPRRTRTGLLKGKLPYMAPEQIRGEPPDARADVWAVGVMLWEALTGRRLFDRDTDFLTYQAITAEPVPSVNTAARYPASVDAVIARALARDREHRTPTARELGRDLQQLAAEVGGAANREHVGDAVAGLCGDKLAARRRAVATAVTDQPRTDAAATPAHTAASSEPGTTPDAAETVSMVMRRDAIIVARKRRRRFATLALAGTAAAAIIGFAASRATHHADPTAIANRTPEPAVPPGSPPPPHADPRATTRSSGADPPQSRPSASTASPRPAGVEHDANPQTSASAAGPAPASGDVAASGRSSASIAPRPEHSGRGASSGGSRAAASHSGGALVAPRGTDPHAPTAASAESGWYAVDSSPYATIFIDERKIGDTPLDRIALPAGSHRVRAVLADGRQRSFAIEIAADRKTSSGTLSW